MYHKTIHENDCGNCMHWQQWDFGRECEQWRRINRTGVTQIGHDRDSIHFGDCDRIVKGTKFYGENGEEYTYDGYSFEDECYDEVFHCFEGSES